ncbi:MAG: 1-deoxy-D-xylulose-5-phosphate reductoisomerase [Elusimicrobia bacterium]|nr:1-deoxy-D-xylulose-5-phosphate reductoisomerase [Elusimicrobiota bacterium]
MKRIAILGSTGSIGVNALRVVERMPERFQVVALAAHSNSRLLARQARKFKPKMVALFDTKAGQSLTGLDGSCKCLAPGVEGLAEMAAHPDVDLVLTSLVGGVGFAPLLSAIRAGKTVALANKEPMVMAGAQFMREAERWQARIIPVDSEPSAIFQCVQGHASARKAGPLTDEIRRVFLTASGGAFYRRKGGLSRVTPAEALRHPTWKMGKKITVDCATLMNKGFESIEIMGLFSLSQDRIEIVIHPQSIIHSGVEFLDGSTMVQMSPPDMRLPIQYAMSYPERGERVIEPLNLFAIKKLSFHKPDFRRFPCLGLAREAANAGGAMPAVLNAADEVAVEAFLSGAIGFTDIPRVIETVMSRHSPTSRLPGFGEVVEVDQWARHKAQEACRSL